ncbi:anti-sigma regulatory factor (Ser/Thr protein kinase) [Catenulispora sp. GP43]|uniref:anti-sigma factor RsbA family regulatory protein n=1 Tax=Catenulispora sp. GP43 TaxID=3156263 RepID=UPI003510F4D2
MSVLPFAARAPVPAEPFRHEAFLYSGDEHFVRGVGAFVRAGLEAGEAVLVAVAEARADLLRQELGRDAGRVEFLDIVNVGRNPARIIPAWQDWVDKNASTARGFRGISEATWAGRTPGEMAECRLHERLVNTAFDGGPGWWLLCPYDVDALPASVIEHAYGSHPDVIADGAGARDAGHPYRGPDFPAAFGEPLEEPSSAVWEVVFDLSSLGGLRDHVTDFAKPLEGYRRVDDAALVVSELAANSIKYGGGGGVLRLWHEGTDLVCEVRDGGVITDPLAGRRRPSIATRGKAGLWIVNQVCDLLQIWSVPGLGTVVRGRLGAIDGREPRKD